MANQSEKTWDVELSELLTRAAELSVEHGIDVDPFVRGAYSAYLDARPGLKEHLEEMQLRAHLDELRKDGRIALA